MGDDRKIIIGIGDGAEQGNYTRKPFWPVLSRKNKRIQVGQALRSFIQKECAKWTGRAKEECLGVDVFCRKLRKPGNCLVLDGKPCPYFERVVLPPPIYRYKHLCLMEKPNIEKSIRKQYAKIALEEKTSNKLCVDCGVAIPEGKSNCCSNCRAARIRMQKKEWKRRNKKQ